MMRQAIILAGGKGTRLAARLNGLPKPLVPIAGFPLLQRQLLSLKEHGICDVLLLVNHKADVIKQFCCEHNDFGMNIRLQNDGAPRGTAGAVLAALPLLSQKSNDVLVLYGDTLFNVDFHRMLRFHNGHSGAATLFLHPNDHPYDSDLIELDEQHQIRKIHPYPHAPNSEYPNLVNAALYIVRQSALQRWAHLAHKQMGILDFAKHLFPAMLDAGEKLFGYNSPEYIKDVGTPDRIDKARADVVSGRYEKGSLESAWKAVFLDRDGVINKDVGFLRSRKEFSLLPGVAGAIRKLNRSGFLTIVVTNQPVIARGECTVQELAAIHAKMDTLLGNEGAYIDRLYYCPHHPDSGFPGEVPELKCICMCRKPQPGMFLQAQEDLHIDLSQSWMIGDRTTDIMAAKNAGVRSVLVRTGEAGRDGKCTVEPDYCLADLSEAVSLILNNQQQEKHYE